MINSVRLKELIMTFDEPDGTGLTLSSDVSSSEAEVFKWLIDIS